MYNVLTYYIVKPVNVISVVKNFKMNYKRIQRCPSGQGFSDDCQSFAKKPRIGNEQFLNFNDPPDFIFNKLKIPRLVGNRISEKIPSVNDTVSPILPPIPGYQESCRNDEDPVKKPVIDDITRKLDEKSPKLKYYRCKECNLSLSGQAPLDDHYAGAKHARKLKQLELISNGMSDLKKDKISKSGENEFKCKLCDVKADSLIHIKSHIDGSKHKNKLQAYREQKNKKNTTCEESSVPNDKSAFIRQGEKGSATKLSANPCSNDKSTAGKANPSRPFYCGICDLCMNSEQQYNQHINSKKHSAKITKLGIAKNEDMSKMIQAVSVPADENS